MGDKFQILCYGDSNTWGCNPADGTRYPADVRWTGVLADSLGEEYHIIEEGLNGRTSVYEDPVEDILSGIAYFKPCLASHMPLDCVVVMLGTNDILLTMDPDADPAESDASDADPAARPA